MPVPGGEHQNDIILYEAADGSLQIQVVIKNESVWLTQEQMAELFQKDFRTISEHIRNIYEEGELEESLTLAKSGNSGNRMVKPKNYYNLDVIISVGYRVKSHRGTQFRIWATQRLREYIVKGFTMDDARLAGGKTRSDYFDELLERVRAIRASEKNLYQKVRDVFATSVDYNPGEDSAKEFFATMQNKFHFAITGFTAAELVVNRIDGTDEHLGMTAWKGERPTSAEAKIAKNYMIPTELRELYLLVEQFMSHAEFQIMRRRQMHMADWRRRLDGFLQLNELEILENAGSVTHEEMEEKVRREMQKFLN
ncbi:MAG: virulence RhuM family protein [Candidatus Magasanikbacteria bacterium]|nr:virulence RhuM family protein [Candidatus Magasanikbacteria bacterium]